MRSTRCSLTAAVVAAATVSALAGAPAPSVPHRLQDGGAVLDVEVGHATPNVVDWDGDGRRDLLVGQFGGGKLRVYRNVGTDAEPRFRGFEYVKAGEVAASVPVS